MTMSRTLYFYIDGHTRMYLLSFRGQADDTMGMVFTPDKNKAHVFVGTEYRPSICAHLLQENVKDAVYVIRFTTIYLDDEANPWCLHKSLTGGGTTNNRTFRAEFPTLAKAAAHLHNVYYSDIQGARTDVDKVWIEKVEI